MHGISRLELYRSSVTCHEFRHLPLNLSLRHPVRSVFAEDLFSLFFAVLTRLHIAPMAPTKKSKSAKSSESISARLGLVVKSGKYSLGYKSALKQMRNSKGESYL